MAKEKIYVLSFENDNIVACLAKNILEAMRKLEAREANAYRLAVEGKSKPVLSKDARLAYISMPEMPPRWYKRLRGESQKDFWHRWMKLITVVGAAGRLKLWRLEEVPQIISGKDIEGY